MKQLARIMILMLVAAGGTLVLHSGVMEEHKKSQAYLKSAAKEPGAVKTSSGLIYKVLEPGTGESPKRTDTVRVHYRGTFIDGSEFNNSYKQGAPIEIRVDKSIKCWTEGLEKMTVGEKAQLVCPPAIAYGDQGLGTLVPPGAVLIFQLELLAIVK
jgi:FKBP-type peptidyl-prolyl cis-trans isomerase